MWHGPAQSVIAVERPVVGPELLHQVLESGRRRRRVTQRISPDFHVRHRSIIAIHDGDRPLARCGEDDVPLERARLIRDGSPAHRLAGVIGQQDVRRQAPRPRWRENLQRGLQDKRPVGPGIRLLDHRIPALPAAVATVEPHPGVADRPARLVEHAAADGRLPGRRGVVQGARCCGEPGQPDEADGHRDESRAGPAGVGRARLGRLGYDQTADPIPQRPAAGRDAKARCHPLLLQGEGSGRGAAGRRRRGRPPCRRSNAPVRCGCAPRPTRPTGGRRAGPPRRLAPCSPGNPIDGCARSRARAGPRPGRASAAPGCPPGSGPWAGPSPRPSGPRPAPRGTSLPGNGAPPARPVGRSSPGSRRSAR